MKYHNAFSIIIVVAIIATGTVMASEPAKDMLTEVVGQEVVVEKGIDNSQLLLANLENFDTNLTINNVLEDEENYYIDYSFDTIAVKDSIWQPIIKLEKFTVNKQGLGDRDLGLYLMEELGEEANEEMIYLKESQKTEAKKGETLVVKTTKYSGLIGLVLSIKDDVLPNYEPVVKPEIVVEQQTAAVVNPDMSLRGSPQASEAIPTPPTPVSTPTPTPLAEPESPVVDKPVVDDAPPADAPLPTDAVADDTATVTDTAATVAADNADAEPPSDDCEVSDTPQSDTPDEPPADESPADEPPADSEPVCDTDHINLCDTQEKCGTAGLYWHGDICNLQPEIPADDPNPPNSPDDSDNPPVDEPPADEPPADPEPVCDTDHINLCDTQEKCGGISLYWYNETCNTEEQEIPVCVPDWSCSGWLPLPETITCGEAFSQTQTCSDINICGIDDGKPAEEQEATGTDASMCGTNFCDATLNLTGECANTCNGSVCQICVPICVCADGFSDCDSDLTADGSNGCEVTGVCD